MSAPPITVRRAGEDDLPSIMALGARSLGWDPTEEITRHFAWKHTENPFGRSPMWVAEIDGRLAGFRTFLRWRFRSGGEHRHAVRAVDTATDPDFQGRGVFTRLTLGALDELRAEGVDFVFNTPNAQSRPGYLKMGWQIVGRLPAVVRPTRLAALGRIARARTPAARGAFPTSVGEPAAALFADRALVADLLVASEGSSIGASAPAALTTDRSPDYLAWRYGPAALHYRVVSAPGGPARGIGVFHLRRRGPATEAVICELLVPGRDARTTRAILRTVADAAGVDYLLALGGTGAASRAPGFLPLPGAGPILTTRAVSRDATTDIGSWLLTLGDVELF